MGKKIIQLNETDFRELVSESVREVLNEIGYRTAALPHGANYNAMQSKLQNADSNAISKMDSANQTRLPAITQSIHDNFPSLILHFIERDKANQYYSVEFSFSEMKVLNDDRFAMKGDISISGQQENSYGDPTMSPIIAPSIDVISLSFFYLYCRFVGFFHLFADILKEFRSGMVNILRNPINHTI